MNNDNPIGDLEELEDLPDDLPDEVWEEENDEPDEPHQECIHLEDVICPTDHVRNAIRNGASFEEARLALDDACSVCPILNNALND